MDKRAFLDKVENLPACRYIVAVSGGIDSVVLLDVLVKQTQAEFIVAHVDHGIREESVDDMRFVKGLAKKYGLLFFAKTLELGVGASEDTARKARYVFLRQLQLDRGAEAIITAHHADDAVETAILNLQRGTGWRGLASLRSTTGTIRPFLLFHKQEIISYAMANQLEFVQDDTNLTDLYARNRVRRYIMPRVNDNARIREQFEALIQAQRKNRQLIETAIKQIVPSVIQKNQLVLAVFLTLPDQIAVELLRFFYDLHGVRQTRPQLVRGLQFLKTATRNQYFSLDAKHFLHATSEKLVVVTTKN